MDRAQSNIELFQQLILHLGRQIKFPRIAIPSIEAHNDEEIEAATSRCRHALQLEHDKPVGNVVRAVEQTRIFTADLPNASKTIDAFSVKSEPRVIVRSSAKGSTSRARFDVAHELGHLVMHSRAIRGERGLEVAADRFAGAFLLPRESFAREFPSSAQRVWPILFRLKARWGTSIQAMVVRGSQLGLIDPSRSSSLWAYISRRGWRRAPEPEEPPAEVPELIPLAFLELHRARRVRPREILDEVGWTDDLFERVVGFAVAREVLDLGAGVVLNLRDYARGNGPTGRSDSR